MSILHRFCYLDYGFEILYEIGAGNFGKLFYTFSYIRILLPPNNIVIIGSVYLGVSKSSLDLVAIKLQHQRSGMPFHIITGFKEFLHRG